MDISVTGNMDMLDSGRLPLVTRHMLLLLSKETHQQVAGEVLQGFPGVVFRPVVEPAHLSALAVTRLA